MADNNDIADFEEREDDDLAMLDDIINKLNDFCLKKKYEYIQRRERRFSAMTRVEESIGDKTETRRKMLLTLLRIQFKEVPKEIENEIFQIADLVALNSFVVLAGTCQSLDEFSKCLRGWKYEIPKNTTPRECEILIAKAKDIQRASEKLRRISEDYRRMFGSD